MPNAVLPPELAGRIGPVCKWSASVLPNCESLSWPKRSSFQSRITGQKRPSVRYSELKRSISGRAHLAGKLWQMVSAPSLLHLRFWTRHRYCHLCHRRQQHKKKTIRELMGLDRVFLACNINCCFFHLIMPEFFFSLSVKTIFHYLFIRLCTIFCLFFPCIPSLPVPCHIFDGAISSYRCRRL